MKCFTQKLLVGIVVIAAILLMIEQYAECIIGDSGKRSPDLKQSLLQDVVKIKDEMKILQTKLNKAQEGKNLATIKATVSANNIKMLFNSLSTKINDAQANQRSTGNIQKLSEGASKGIIIINGLEQKVGANMKSDSLKLLNELSKLLIGLESEINRLYGAGGYPSK